MKNKQPRLFPITRLPLRQFLRQQNSWRKLESITWELNINKLLNSCIQVKEAQISLTSAIPCQINFRLDSDIINQIEQIRQDDNQFTLSPINLTNLRYYVLLNSPLKKQLSPICNFQSSLIFSTNYLYSDKQQLVPVVRSIINLEGQISQQIKQDLWQEPQLLDKVLDVHYWLISQILNQLPLKNKNFISWFFNGLLLSIGTVIAVVIWYFLSLNYLSKILIIFAIFCGLKVLLEYLVKKHLKSWIIDNLTHGFLANKHQKRKFGFKILSLMH